MYTYNKRLVISFFYLTHKKHNIHIKCILKVILRLDNQYIGLKIYHHPQIVVTLNANLIILLSINNSSN